MDDTTVAEYDLLPTLVTKLDRHLIFPLLEFRRGQLENEDGVSKDEAKSRELLKATYELLRKTNMTDYVANLYCDLEGLQDPPKEYADKRQKVLETLEKYEETTGKIQELLGREDVVTNLRSDKVANLEFLKKEHDVSAARLLSHTTSQRSCWWAGELEGWLAVRGQRRLARTVARWWRCAVGRWCSRQGRRASRE